MPTTAMGPVVPESCTTGTHLTRAVGFNGEVWSRSRAATSVFDDVRVCPRGAPRYPSHHGELSTGIFQARWVPGLEPGCNVTSTDWRRIWPLRGEPGGRPLGPPPRRSGERRIQHRVLGMDEGLSMEVRGEWHHSCSGHPDPGRVGGWGLSWAGPPHDAGAAPSRVPAGAVRTLGQRATASRGSAGPRRHHGAHHGAGRVPG